MEKPLQTNARGWLASVGLFVAVGLPGFAVEAAPTNQSVEAALTCQCGCGLTVHNCNHLQCGFAIPAKEQIAEQLEQGRSYDAILASFVERYGEKVLSAPTATGFNLAAWVVPFLAVIVGAAGIGLFVLRWARRRPKMQDAAPPHAPATSGPYADRLKRELDTFEN